MSRCVATLARVTLPDSRPYHHGDLRRTLILAAVARVEEEGPSNVSLRDIARRAGVSHAAPAHHFGDKTGLFTAIATEGFLLLASKTTPVANRHDALLLTGIVYVRFAVEHRGYFEVMFRPDLYRETDPELVRARDRSLEVLYSAARQGAGMSERDDITGLAVAAWSVVHGFATLWLAGNFRRQLPADLDAGAAIVAAGIAKLGEIIGSQLG
jgi:AcrR family transcriptional regulator